MVTTYQTKPFHNLEEQNIQGYLFECFNA
jgi:hypothetical protein